MFIIAFFIPYRLLWKDWEDFITGGRQGNSNPVFPRYKLTTSGVINQGTLFDYLGFPAGQTLPVGYEFSALPFFAYRLIYDQYYRDQNLESPSIEENLPSSVGIVELPYVQVNTFDSFALKLRSWEKDYFTSALPWAQRGGEVNLPISGMLPVEGILTETGNESFGQIQARTQAGNLNLNTHLKTGVPTPSGAFDLDLKANLGEGTSVTINDLRRSIKLQEWLEKNARGGARYIEQIFSHFGVKSSDARLQRVEFLGGGKTPVVISEVLQTSATQAPEIAETPLASMAGHGISVGSTHEFTKFFEEHGIVMGIMSVMPKTAYQQGTPRMFTKFDKFDYYFYLTYINVYPQIKKSNSAA
jgi:hypothetical protein